MNNEYVVCSMQGPMVDIMSNSGEKRRIRKDLLFDNKFFISCINVDYIKQGIVLSDVVIKNYSSSTENAYEVVYKEKINNKEIYLIVSSNGDIFAVSNKTYEQLIKYNLIRTPNGRLFKEVAPHLIQYALQSTKSGMLERSLSEAVANSVREHERMANLTKMQFAEDRARNEKARIYEEAKALYDSAMKKMRWHRPITKAENEAVIYIQALNKHQDDIAAKYERRCAKLKNIDYSAYDVAIGLDTGLQVA